ncbi:helix-turn-helix transcriptional regulator [Nocardiopsis quinghaiensis]|uniref:helix-turn-helix transcriptional regulator n=1 Tax=Nocardiopsis quinghaiensis TaxID=464995 RepID=UPI00123B98E0|nr:LuxR family transcriptional regulator [Nocardiopsis quinghaiensis]
MHLVQREHERALIRSLYAECLRGRGQIVHITGPTASGKSALLDDFVGHVTASGGMHIPVSGVRGEQDLPLGLLNQIMVAVGLSPVALEARRVSELPQADLLPWLVPRLEEVCRELRLTASEAPLTVHVDDAHLADAPSVRCLLYVLRRLRRVPLMAVVTERSPSREGVAEHLAELSLLPQSTQIRLAPLGTADVRELLSGYFTEAGDEAVADLVRITGGVPGLVSAVLGDHLGTARRTPRYGAPSRFRPGESYRAAFVEYLRRHGPSAMELAKVLAVMGETDARDEPLPHVLTRWREAGSTLHRLGTAGLLDSDGFRHPEARAAVLDLMGPDERAGAHLGCARLLYENDAPVIRVARHLRATDRVSDPWAVPLLCTAAEQAMAGGDLAFAIDCLSSASAFCTDEGAKPRIAVALAATLWRVDPEAATRHLLRLTGDALAGRLPACELYALLRGLLWAGHRVEAERVLRGMPEAVRGDSDPDASVEARITRAVCATTHPEVTVLVPGAEGAGEVSDAPSIAKPILRLSGAESLATALAGTDDRCATDRAEEVLTNAGLGEHMVEAVSAALSALVYTDRLDRAVYWGESLIDAPDRSPLWRGQAHMLRAHVALRTGDLGVARHHAKTALSTLSVPGWGVVAGLPLGDLLLIAEATGDRREVARVLAEPVTEEVFRSRFGLHYLYARGHHHLNAGRAQCALADFSVCGELMTRWGMDTPSLVPWRGGTARAHLRLGEPGAARRLVVEQEALAAPGRPRTRGVVLRDLATVLPPEERVPVLEDAIHLLDRAPDALEASRSRLDLADTYEVLGDGAEAVCLRERARRSLAEHSAPLVGEHGAPVPAPAPGPGARAGDRLGPRPAAPELTRAESRVAVLAAKGLTNRQISSNLHITVSTVEQHLTRIYRKFDITERQRIADVLPRDRDMAR